MARNAGSREAAHRRSYLDVTCPPIHPRSSSRRPYSPFRVANGLVFVSGQLGLDTATGNLVAGGVKEQTVGQMVGIAFSLITEQEAVLNRYFKDHKVKKLMKVQQEVGGSGYW